MNAQDFTYWLQGFAELNSQPPTAEQWQSIREHLTTVFQKVTPPVTPKNTGFVNLDLWQRNQQQAADRKCDILTPIC